MNIIFLASEVNNYKTIALIFILVSVLLLAGLIVVSILLSKQIRNLKNNVRQLTNYPVKPTLPQENNNIEKESVVEPVKIVKETPTNVEIKEEEKKSEIKEVKKATDKMPKEEKPQTSKLKELIKEEEAKEVKTGTTTRVVLGKYEVFSVNDFYLYRLKASNGEIMIISEVYTTEKGAISAIETIKKNAETGTIQIYQDKHDLFQFKLFAKNKRLLAVSANYTSQAKCESAANSFKKFAPISPVIVLEEDPDHLMEEIHVEAMESKKGGKITIYGNETGYEFRLHASNGVVLCTSNEYKTKTALTNGISTFKSAVKTGRFFIVKDKNDTFQFKLYNTDRRCIVIGEAYKNKNQAVSAANSLISFVNLADTIDKSEEEVKGD